MAGVNVLLMQQVQEVAADTPADCVQVTDWFGRLKYIQDSYAAEVTEKTDREQELDEVKAELARPLINGNKVLMTVMNIPVVYGTWREETKLIGFFDDGFNCSIIRTSRAEELGLWGEPVTLELGTVNATLKFRPNSTVLSLWTIQVLDIFSRLLDWMFCQEFCQLSTWR